MRYGIFSDVHSNLEAFESVIAALKEERTDSCICAGDIVGYGADPSICIKLTKEFTPHVICGNHDWASIGMFDTSYFNPYAKKAVYWTSEKLSESEKDYLKGLKVSHEEDDFIAVHGSPEEPEGFHYILDLYSAVRNFSLMQKRICFIGHSHAPIIFLRSGEDISYTQASKIKLKKGTSYIVNVGSVGQPRDGDPRACYALYDADKGTIEIKRTPYNIKKAQNKILAAGLPPLLAERLDAGH